MILLIGTGHVFDLSSALLRIFDDKQPDVMCVELDKQRYEAVMKKLSNPEEYKAEVKQLPFLYRLLSKFQNNLASEYGVTAGDEMLLSINYAQAHQIPVKFIDMNAQHLFSKMLKSMSFSEKLKLLLTGLGGFFVSKQRVEKELTRFEKDFDAYIEQIGEKLPTIKRVLIDERNEYMTQQLVEINTHYNKVLALVGDGHIVGISQLLTSKDVTFETIRLRELRNQKPHESDATTASFTTEYGL